MAKNTSQIPNAYQTVFSKETKSARYQFEQVDADYQKGLEAVAQMIENSKLDAKLKQMLQVQMKNLDSAKTSKQIESFIQQYSQEAKLGKRQLKYLDSMKSEIEKLRELESNRFKAELKYQGGSLSGLKEAFQRGGMKGAVGYGKAAMKSMSPGSMMKAGLHGVGVIADSPALNMLASSLKFDKDDRSYEASEEIRSILEGNSEAASESYSDTKRTSKATKKIADQNTEIVGELKRANQTLDEMLFRQKDMADDYKVIASRTESIATATQSTQKTTEEKKDSDWGIFGDLFDKKKGRLSKLLKGGVAAGAGSKLAGYGSRGLGLLKGASPFLSKAGPLAMLGGALYGAYQGYQFDKDASQTDKILSGLSGAINMLTFGAFGNMPSTILPTSVTTGKPAKRFAEADPATQKAILEAAKVTGMDPFLMKKIAFVESGFDPNAIAKRSSAEGLYQFTDDTWNRMLKNHGGKYGLGPMSSKFDPRANALMGAEFLKENKAALEKIKGKGNVGSDELYAAHFMGINAAKRFYSALAKNPNASAVSVLGQAAADANPSIFYRDPTTRTQPTTLAEVDAWLNKKMMVPESVIANPKNLTANAQSTQVPKVSAPSATLNSQTERALNGKKSKTLRDELMGTDKIAAAVKAGMEGANIVAVQAPGKKSDNIPLEDHSLDSIRLMAIK